MSKILLLEDEEKIGRLVSAKLRVQNHVVLWVQTVKEAMRELDIEQFDVCVLDLMLPDGEGTEVLAFLRKVSPKTPAIALTAKDDVEDIVNGLDYGFDDYLPKPFSMPELFARIRAVLRRGTTGEAVLSCGEISFFPDSGAVQVKESDVELTAKEAGILEYLLRHKGNYVSQEELLEKLWESNYEGLSNTVVVHVKNLRAKLGMQNNKTAAQIVSKRGKGYKLTEN